MKAILKNYRYWVMTLLLCIVMVLTMLDVNDDVTGWEFVYIIVSSKLLAVAFGYLEYRLYKYWAAKGQIPELCKSTNK